MARSIANAPRKFLVLFGWQIRLRSGSPTACTAIESVRLNQLAEVAK